MEGRGWVVEGGGYYGKELKNMLKGCIRRGWNQGKEIQRE